MNMAMVVDIPLHGMSYTWTNNRERSSWARLDRFLCTPLFLYWFPSIVQKGFCRSISDHNLILLEVPKEDWGHRPFRIQNVWLEDRVLMKGVHEVWKYCSSANSFGVSIVKKSRAIKNFMKERLG
ncbi:hypothetical protein Ddye_006380 [Dipteronia dyeriana]|uniref:Uncharacterized protein n=1 Tax=Dipteronia dyeriana TaxID=168575 RepID=A0AAE0CQL8_9ROSI|nr:hypothetical protein Ddye_006380 [Dipteronia dyeriana]